MALPYSPERIAEGQARLETAAAAEGLAYGRRSHWFDTRPAHEATLWAADLGAADRMKRAIFPAYFVEGRNIGSPEVLAEIATAVDLDGADLRAALEEGRYAEAVSAQFAEARAIGVTAVPTFVIADRYAIMGAHPVEGFRQMLGRVRAPRRD